MGVSLVITSAKVTEMSHMELLNIIVFAMFGFHCFIRQYWSCMLPCALDELLVTYSISYCATTCTYPWFIWTHLPHWTQLTPPTLLPVLLSLPASASNLHIVQSSILHFPLLLHSGMKIDSERVAQGLINWSHITCWENREDTWM